MFKGQPYYDCSKRWIFHNFIRSINSNLMCLWKVFSHATTDMPWLFYLIIISSTIYNHGLIPTTCAKLPLSQQEYGVLITATARIVWDEERPGQKPCADRRSSPSASCDVVDEPARQSSPRRNGQDSWRSPSATSAGQFVDGAPCANIPGRERAVTDAVSCCRDQLLGRRATGTDPGIYGGASEDEVEH